ncbi:ABC-type transport system ATP-binding protein (probable substrate zinc/manganese/metal ions)-like protein, partial [Leptotrombidium deliense]
MALVVENLNFSYTNRSILTNICMSVSKGSIYALLGPSGCGKTTFFKLIIGLNKPNSGSIHIFGYPPGSEES